MKSMIAVLAILVVAPQAWAQQQDGWSEVRFHRVHLHNGNFIDGNVISDKPNEVILLLKAGEMSIRRDQIEKVELVKMKSWNEKPIILTPAVNPANPGSKTDVPQANVFTSTAVKLAIDKMIAKVKSSTGEKEFNIDELKATGDDGAAYLATKVAAGDLVIQNAVMAALINLKDRGPKLSLVLDGFLSGSVPSLRALALTVLTVDGGDSALSKYVRPALKDTDPGVRVTAISALSAIEDKFWFDDVADLFGDTNKDVRSRAITLAKRLSAKAGLQDKLLAALASNLRSSDAGVRGDMSSTIGTLNIQQAWSSLTPLLSDQEAAVRAQAATALQTLAAPESIPEVVQAMRRETDKYVRISLAGVAQRLRVQEAVEPMIPWLGTADVELQNAVEVSLRTITGETHGKDMAKWQAWFQSRK